MKPEHTMCEHIKLVNQMMQEIIHSGKSMGENSKKFAFYSTLPFKDGQHYLRLWDSSDRISYDDSVYLFLEDNISHNLNRTSKLAITPNSRIAKRSNTNFPWFKKMTTSIMEKEKIEESMPVLYRFR